MKKQRIFLHSPLWLENASALRAHKIAVSNERHRRLFPWLFVLAVLSVLALYLWATS